jgi:hypothetical protein
VLFELPPSAAFLARAYKLKKIQVLLVILPASVVPSQVSRLTDVTKLGGTIAADQGFGMATEPIANSAQPAIPKIKNHTSDSLTIASKSASPQTQTQTQTQLQPESQPSPSQVNNASGGIIIGKDNNGTATVNNFAPPQRHLTDTQKTALEQASILLDDNCHMLTVVDPEAQQYAVEIQNALSSGRQKRISMTTAMWAGGIPKGILVQIQSSTDEKANTAQRLLRIMDSIGLSVIPQVFVVPGLDRGSLLIVVGSRQ